MTESDILRLKAEGVKDCVKWLNKKIKETKKELDACYFYNDHSTELSNRIREQIEIKISLEKYAKKLKHEANEIDE